MLFFGPYVLLLYRWNQEDALVSEENFKHASIRVDPEDLRVGSEIDLEHVWMAAKSTVAARLDIGHAIGLFTPPERTASAVLELSSNDSVVLISQENVASVILFYSSWCGHCRHYAPQYDKLARHFVSKYDVIFAGVNCPDQHAACSAHSISAYPTVRVFNFPVDVGLDERFRMEQGKGMAVDLSRESEALRRFISSCATLRKHGLVQSLPMANAYPFSKQKDSEIRNQKQVSSLFGQASKSFAALPKERLNDGITSLKFLLTDGFSINIYQQKLQSMQALLRLVLRALPRANSTDAGSFVKDITSLEVVLAYLESLNPISLPSDAQVHVELKQRLFAAPATPLRWTVCGVAAQGPSIPTDLIGSNSSAKSFTCGLWQLFHFLTVAGSASLASPGEYSTPGYSSTTELRGTDDSKARAKELELVLRDVIDHSFSCSLCRENFLKDYNACSFGRCTESIYEQFNIDPFIRLQLWLFALHNGVNLRVPQEQNFSPDLDRYQTLWPAADKTRDFAVGDIIRALRANYWDDKWGKLKSYIDDARRLNAYFRHHNVPFVQQYTRRKYER